MYHISSNKHHPRVVAAATIRGTCIRMRIISDDGNQTSARAVCVVQLISTADSRTERLHLVLTASNSRHRIARMYLIQPLLMLAGFPKK